MPQLFAAIVEHNLPGHTVETKFLGGGGATLEKHWEVGLVQEALKSEKWDYVVLQEQSKLGSDDLADPESPNTFFRYAERFDKEIKANGAATVFYMTWSRKQRKEEQVYLTKAYTRIAEKLGSTLAPVGLAWDDVRDNPALELYDEDGSHPSLAGSYLAALTLAATLFGEMEETPGELHGFEILRGGKLSEQRSRLSNLPAEQVQHIAAGVGRAMQNVR